MANFAHRTFYCVTDGGHIYTRNKDLDNQARKSEDDEYKVSVGSSFHIPDKPSEQSNHIVIEHIDELPAILREQPESDADKLIYMIHKADNLEAIVWQLYDAGFRPNIKYGAG